MGITGSRDITDGHYRQQEISLLGITGSKRYHCWALTQKVFSAVNMAGLLKTSIVIARTLDIQVQYRNFGKKEMEHLKLWNIR